MPYFSASDGASLFYRRWGAGSPVVFLHGWALNSEAWQSQMIALSQQGLSCIAYDRRGHGRSDDPGEGYDYDSLADDLNALMERLDLREATLVGHSMGNGESVRYLTRHGGGRVARLAMIAPALPFILRTPDNPGGPNERGQLDAWRGAWKNNYVEWLSQAVPAAFGADGSPDRIQWAMRMMLQCTIQAAIGTNVASAETDFRNELPQIKVPTLIIHGDEDVSTPLEATGRKVAQLIAGSQLKVYQGARHSLIGSHADQLNRDILAFVRN